MSSAATQSAFADTLIPQNVEEVAAAIRTAANESRSVCPIGGLTGLGRGIAVPTEATAISTAELNSVVDYPHEDMTITVGSGITIAELQRNLAEHGQRLPVEIPQSDVATLGGAIATNQSGPARYGCGTLRDYVIGITAVDGRGTIFSGGGRVVKNVAGYDFCKLLIGSRGTLAAITQVTLKVMPMPEQTALFAARLAEPDAAVTPLSSLSTSSLTPQIVDFVCGSAWQAHFASNEEVVGHLVFGFEGTAEELAWLKRQTLELGRHWGTPFEEISPAAGTNLRAALCDFPAADDSGVTFVANVLPSGVPKFVAVAREVDPAASILARAGNGIVYVRSSLSGVDAISAHAKVLLPQARKLQGNCLIYSAPSDLDVTPLAAFGAPPEASAAFRSVKQTFDPHGIMSPGCWPSW